METLISDFLDSMSCLQAPIDEPAIENGIDDSAKAAKVRQFFARARGLAFLGGLLRKALVESLQVGVEGRVLATQLQRAKASTEANLEGYDALRKVVARWPGVLQDSEAAELDHFAREAQEFLGWIQSLLTRLQSPRTFDESKLPPAPDGPTAEGYISVSEARARLHARRKA